MAVRSLIQDAENATTRIIEGWLGRLDWTGKVLQRRADLIFEGSCPYGPLNVAAISPYMVAHGIPAVCEPCLVRFDVGERREGAVAWTPLYGNDTLSVVSLGSDWVSGALFAGPGPPDVLGARLGSSLSPTDVSRFLELMSNLTRADENAKRETLWCDSQEAIRSLYHGFRGKRRQLATHTGEMAVLAGTGAIIGLYASVVLGPIALELMPFTSGVGALCGVGVWGMRLRDRESTISTEMKTIEADLRSLDFFETIERTSGRGGEWEAGMLVHRETREMMRCSITIEGQVEGRITRDGPTVTAHLFRFALPERANPRARLLPSSWVVVTVAMPEDLGFISMGELRPVPGSRALGSWMSGEDLLRGGLKVLLEPLSIFAPRPKHGPYR
jgi:hypothetical protein